MPSDMGYHLYITRAARCNDSAYPRITPGEWLAVVAEDPALRLAGYNGPHYALWSGDEECGRSQYPEPWLNWMRGDVYSKNPDPPVIRKMLRVAERLGARVRGDDWEVYTRDEDAPDGYIYARTD